jgi:hypothetical protein
MKTLLGSILGALTLAGLVLLQSTKKPKLSGMADEQLPDLRDDRENDRLDRKDQSPFGPV